MIIKMIFKKIGAAAASAKRLWEFKIAEKNDAKDINNKNGKVILVKSMAKLIFSLSLTDPGAINDTNIGIKISITKTKTSKLKNKILNTSFANLFDFFPFVNSVE